MKKQEQTPQNGRQNIFASDFKQEVRKITPPDFSTLLRFSLPKAVLGIGLVLLLPVLFVHIQSTPHSWWSATTSGSILQSRIHTAVADRTQLATDLKDISYRVHSLEEVEYTPNSPSLSALYDEKKALPSWKRMLTGVDQVVREVVSANSILRQITIGNILFDKESGQIVLESVRIMKGEGGSVQESTVSLAGKLVESLESSPYFKDVQSSDLAIKEQVTGTGSNIFTPVNVQMQYQFEAEKSNKDKQYDLKEELDSLLQQ